MIVIPAIDLKGGQCVRLLQGRAEAATVYSGDPVDTARRWIDDGAAYLHIVDLDGAFSGHPVHTDVIRRIAAAVPVPVEVGGGLRTDADVQRILDCGAARAILGTRAATDTPTLSALVARHGDRIAVGIDARDGRVRIRGWVEATPLIAVDLARRVAALGVATLIYTDTATDGMLGGPNTRAVAEVCDAAACGVIASGGVSSVGDAEALAALARPNLVGMIVGKALYEGTVGVRALREAVEERRTP